MTAFWIACLNFSVLWIFFIAKGRRPFLNWVVQRHLEAKTRYEAVVYKKKECQRLLEELEKKQADRPERVFRANQQRSEQVLLWRQEQETALKRLAESKKQETQRRLVQMERDLEITLLSDWGLTCLDRAEALFQVQCSPSEQARLQQVWIKRSVAYGENSMSGRRGA